MKPRSNCLRVRICLLFLGLNLFLPGVVLGQQKLHTGDFVLLGSVYRCTASQSPEGAYTFTIHRPDGEGDTVSFQVLSLKEEEIHVFASLLTQRMTELVSGPFDSTQVSRATDLASEFTEDSSVLSAADKYTMEQWAEKAGSGVSLGVAKFKDLFGGMAPGHPSDSAYFQSLIERIDLQHKDVLAKFNDEIKSITTTLYKQVEAASRTVVTQSHPIGAIRLHEKIKVFTKTGVDNKKGLNFLCRAPRDTSNLLDVDSMVIEFCDGTIKDVDLYTHTSCGAIVVFSNLMPISFSSKYDITKLSVRNDRQRKLYAFKIYYNQGHFDSHGTPPFIYIDEVMDYVRFISLLTEDYSPGNQVITIKPGQPLLHLEKETSSQVVEARIFSDLVGIDDNQPNGQIQVEVWKKLILNAKNVPIFPTSEPENLPGKALKHPDSMVFQDVDLVIRRGRLHLLPTKEASYLNRNPGNPKIKARLSSSRGLLSYRISEKKDTIAITGPDPRLKFKVPLRMRKIRMAGDSLLIFGMDSVAEGVDTLKAIGARMVIKSQDPSWEPRPHHIWAYSTWLPHITPRLRLTDINATSNPLITSQIYPTRIDPASDTLLFPMDTLNGIHPLRLYQYSNMMAGGTLGLFDLTVNNLKSTFSLAFDAYFSQTNLFVRDTNTRMKVNAIILGPSLTWRINPHTHTEASLAYRLDFMDALTDELVTTKDSERFIGKQKEYLGNKLFHSFHFMGIWRVREEKQFSDKISLRASFHAGARSFNTNFFQLQIGYTMNISRPNPIPHFKGGANS